MSELNEKVEEAQEQASVRPPIPRERLKDILEAHRKWVESEGKEGGRAFLLAANLQGANLFRANLQGANLQGANLQGANLVRANLQGAGLTDANLQGADLRDANLQGAGLTDANLQGANLIVANLQGANLIGANLQGAGLLAANLQGAALVAAKGLTASQIKPAKNWQLAYYSEQFLEKLGLPPDHNETLPYKLVELGSLNLRDFPEDLHRALKAGAAMKGMSLRDYTVKLIREGLKRERGKG